VVVTRFAPSPTGYLHLGHVVNAIYVWGMAHAQGGRVLLRIEDHDRIRSRPAYEAALLEDLDWLGFMAHEGRHPPFRQSDHSDAYQQALDRLRTTARVYACDCSRKDILVRARRFGGHVNDERYDGRCRTRGLADGPGRGLRVQIDDAPEAFDDWRLGRIEQTPSEQCGDILLRDRDGHWTYQFAVVVDDMRQGVTLVIRGEDLLSSTGRQLRLARLLGRATPPSFLHHPLILKQGTELSRSGGQHGGRQGEKLSKAAGDTGVRDLRARGVPAADVIGRAAAAVELIAAPRAIVPDQVAGLFQGAVLRRT
jgi:glutamyl-Q tRNA(Asp) synthetase